MSAYINRKCYGFIKNKEVEFTPHPEEAAAVKLIFECFLKGSSLNRIIETLGVKGILSPSGKAAWSRKAISSVLSNEKYHIYGVVSVEIFNMVQNEKEQRIASGKSMIRDYVIVEEPIVKKGIQRSVNQSEGINNNIDRLKNEDNPRKVTNKIESEQIRTFSSMATLNMVEFSERNIGLILFFGNLGVLIMHKDDIFSVILKHRLPVQRNNQTVKEYLSSYYIEYIDAIDKAVNNTSEKFLQDSCYDSLKEKAPQIKILCEDIVQVLSLYDGPDIIALHATFDIMMERIKRYLFVNEVGSVRSMEYGQMFRIREGIRQYQRKDLFHIPMNKRQFIKSYRYSIPGYPCIYLATGVELCWFECGMPKKFSYSMFQINANEGEKVRLINFKENPVQFVSSLTTSYYNYKDDRDKIDEYIIKYLITHPLRVACSIQAFEKQSSFVEEYILPQLLLLWVRKNDEFDGIAYTSCSSIEEAHEWNYFNIVFPTKEIENGYCKRLSKIFKISNPVKVEISEIFESRSHEIDKVRNFVKRLENKYYNGNALYLYREMLSLCKSFLLVIDNLKSDNYHESESIYQTIDTLNLMSYMIVEHKEVYKNHMLSKSFAPNNGEEVEKEFYEVIEEFNTEVKLTLFDVWSYAFRISCDSKVDHSTLEYL